MVRFTMLAVALLVLTGASNARGQDTDEVKRLKEKVELLETKLKLAERDIQDLKKENDQLKASGAKDGAAKKEGLPTLAVGSRWEGKLKWSDNSSLNTKFVVAKREGNDLTLTQENEDGATFEWVCTVKGERVEVTRVERKNVVVDKIPAGAAMGGFKPTVTVTSKRMVIPFTWDMGKGKQSKGTITLDRKDD